MTSNDLAVQVSHLVKRYGDRTAVDDVSFAIGRGEVFAVLGPNGAGKTSVVETLEGFRRPDSGTVRVLGLDPATDGTRLRARIGVMLQEGGLYPAITPREALSLFSQLYPRSRPAHELMTVAGIEGFADTRWRRLSGGEKQRVKLALALLPDPELIFLDEPTAGMDPAARRTTWETIRGLRAAGTTVVLTTHYLEEAEHLADRVAILVDGRLAALDRPAALTRGAGDRVTVRLACPPPAAALSLPAARSARVDGATATFETEDAPALLVQVAQMMRDAAIPILEMRVGNGSLEEIFLQLASEALQ